MYVHVELQSDNVPFPLGCHLLRTLCGSDSVMSVTPAVSFMLVDVLSACRTCGHHVPAPGRLNSKSYLWHCQRLYFSQWLQGICATGANYILELLSSLEIMLSRRYA